jgi:ribonuclease D
MNSSTFRPILGLVQVAAKGSRGVNVRYNTQKNWQRLSFKTLEAVTAVLGNVRFAS